MPESTKTFTLSTIVEGHGEVEALPVLLRRLRPNWKYPRPIRVSRWKIVQHDQLERYAQLAAATVKESGGPGGVLVVLDAETDLACTLAPSLLERLNNSIPYLPHHVVLPTKHYEAWIVGGDAFKGAAAIEDPEHHPSPKQFVRSTLGVYRPTVDQPRLSARIDLVRARSRCPSFDKLIRCMDAFDQI